MLAGGENWLHPYVATRPPQLSSSSRSNNGRIILMRHRIQAQSDWEVPRNRHREDCTSWCEPGRKDKARHYRRHGVQVTLAFTVGGGMSQKSISFFDNIRLPQINCRCSTWTWCFLVLTRVCFPRSRVCVCGKCELI